MQTILISDEVKAVIEQLAAKQELSESQLVKLAIARYQVDLYEIENGPIQSPWGYYGQSDV